MMSFNRILYSTDLSKGSEEAFQQAAFLAKKTGADIHILHVVEKLSNDAKMTLNTYVMDSNQRAEMLLARKSHAEQKLKFKQDRFWESVNDEDKEIRKQIKSINVVESYPMEEILTRSKALDVDLIVMGTHEKGFKHTFLGSVVKNVLNHSTIPVMVVPTNVESVKAR